MKSKCEMKKNDEDFYPYDFYNCNLLSLAPLSFEPSNLNKKFASNLNKLFSPS